MSEYSEWTDDDTITEARHRYQWALDDLQALIVSLCPGPHEVSQRRDGKPPWCGKCGRDFTGHPTGTIESGAQEGDR